MADKAAANSDDVPADFASVAAPAPGGTLAEYLQFRQALGRTAVLAPHGRWGWAPGERGVIERVPMECADPPDPAEVRALLRRPGVRLVNYLLPPDAAHPANCFDYLCRDPDYRLEALPSAARRDTRRGLRHFRVRLCTVEEFAEKGLASHADTLARHGDSLEGAAIRRPADDAAAARFIDTWGAWDGDDLAAWMRVFRVDDWALIASVRSRTDALKGCPNNALLYAATRKYLAHDRLRYVTYGLSTLQATATEVSTHRYKTRMGYEAVPQRRVFAAHPLAAPLLATRPGSWLLDRLSGAMPASAFLRKAAGLARLMSGRDRDPLGWAAPAPADETASRPDRPNEPAPRSDPGSGPA